MEVTDDGLGRINRPYVAEGWGRHAEGPNEVVLDHVVKEETGVDLGDSVTLVLNGTSVEFDVVGFASQPDHAYYVPSADVLFPFGSLVAAYVNRTRCWNIWVRAPRSATGCWWTWKGHRPTTSPKRRNAKARPWRIWPRPWPPPSNRKG